MYTDAEDGIGADILIMIEPYVNYMHARCFVVPEIERRYYRLFGDLEYDIMSLRTEIAVSEQRLDVVRRRIKAALPITARDERNITSASHELHGHRYHHLEQMHARIAAAKAFRYDPETEQHGRYMLADIALAILGLKDPLARARRGNTLDQAAAAYARLDIADMMDLHESVQDLLACERRDTLSAEEQTKWRGELAALYARHPARLAEILNSPEAITRRTRWLRRRADVYGRQLAASTVVYAGAIRVIRFRN